MLQTLLPILLLMATPPATEAEPPDSPPAATQDADPDATPPLPANPADAATPPRVDEDPRFGLLTIPPDGTVPPIVDLLQHRSMADLRARARAKDYARQINKIRRQYLGTRSERMQQRGIAELLEFTDPAAFEPLLVELARESDLVRMAIVEHLEAQGEAGQAALAWAAVHHPDDAIRNEAGLRVTQPVGDAVKAVLEAALRSNDHHAAANAGGLAGALNVLETIPLLIQAQAAPVRRATAGDLAWIAVQKETVYVERLAPVVGDATGAYVPITNTLNEGFVFRAVDAVVIVYRTEIHHALVSMTTNDWGQPTAAYAYD
ncbi:MAG: hypothetical protein ACYTF9_12265, partial [Planctomycetota bacterium]